MKNFIKKLTTGQATFSFQLQFCGFEPMYRFVRLPPAPGSGMFLLPREIPHALLCGHALPHSEPRGRGLFFRVTSSAVWEGATAEGSNTARPVLLRLSLSVKPLRSSTLYLSAVRAFSCSVAFHRVDVLWIIWPVPTEDICVVLATLNGRAANVCMGFCMIVLLCYV